MDRKNYIQGLILGGSAFVIWGLLPLYWRLVDRLDAYQLFSQRVVWSFIFICLILLSMHRFKAFKDLIFDKSKRLYLIGSSIFISINWLVYIWAVNHGYVVESSLGYYINPLILTVFGALFFKERVNRLEMIGIGFALFGVAMKTLLYGRVPVIALVLATSFAIYSVLKKKAKVDSITGIAFETMVVGIPSLLYLIFCETSGTGITGNIEGAFWFIIGLSGIATATPLILYAESSKKLPLNVLGFLQYISPTISLILGVFVFKERFDLSSLMAFTCIWIGLALFSYSQIKLLGAQKNEIASLTHKKGSRN